MRKLRIGAMGALFAGMASIAQALPVSFSTEGEFSGTGAGAGTCANLQCAQQIDGAAFFQLLFAGEASVGDTPLTADLGVFTLNTGGGGALADVAAGLTFDLTINQTVPGVASGDFSSTLTGTVGTASGELVLSFVDPTFVTLAGVKYTLQLQDAFNDGSANDLIFDTAFDDGQHEDVAIDGFGTSATELKARITAVPEPGSMALFGLGALGLGAIRRRFAA